MALDPVNPKALKGKFKDREDKDIDNDGDSDSSDEYLHKRRQAVSKAIGKKVEEAKMTPDQMKKALASDKAQAQPKDKVSLKKPPFKMDEAVTLDYSRYMRAHGKKPRDAGMGSSTWMFTTSEFGDPSEDEIFQFQGSFADAKKAAAKWAKSQGEYRFYVVEEAKMTPDQMKKALASDKAQAQPKDMDEAAKTDDHWVHINHAGSSHSPTKDKIVGYSRPSKDAPKLKDGANGAMRVGTAKKKGYTISETFDLDEAKLPAHIIRGDKYDGIPDGIVAQAKDTVKKMNLDRSDQKQAAMYKALSDLGWEMTVAGKHVKESVASKVLRRMSEAKDDYTVAHNSFSSAVQHAEEVTKKRGFEVDSEEWDRKVAMGPRKPGAGKTNSYNIGLMKNGKEVKQKLNMQVYYDEGRYELNMYIS